MSDIAHSGLLDLGALLEVRIMFGQEALALNVEVRNHIMIG